MVVETASYVLISILPSSSVIESSMLAGHLVTGPKDDLPAAIAAVMATRLSSGQECIQGSG